MILTDREIQACLASGQLGIEPAPPLDNYSATTVDLTLGKTIQEWLPAEGAPMTVRPGRPGYSVADVIERYTRTVDISGGYVISPQQFLLAWTAERVILPKESRIAARVEGKSSLARIAIGVHICAPTIHPGFDRPLQLEICNHGTLGVELLPGMRICQVIFESTMGTPQQEYDGQFKRQGPGRQPPGAHAP